MSRTFLSGAFSVLWIFMSGGGATAVETVKGELPARKEATFTISFEGLMVHVGDENDSSGLFKQHLAILNAPGHEAMAKDMASVHEDLSTYCEGAEELVTIGSGGIRPTVVDSACSNSA